MDLVQLRARPAVEDQEETGFFAVLLDDRLLAVLQDGGLQFDVPRLVDAVDVAEGGGQQVAGALDRVQAAGDLQGVLGGGVELGARPRP